MKRLLLATLIALVGATAGHAQSQKQPSEFAQSVAKIRKAPDFTLPDAQGKMVSLSSLRGSWVVLDFWGSWCGWCIKGFPQMKENYAKFNPKVKFVGVAIGDKKETWLRALRKYELPWINLWEDPDIDRRNSVVSLYGVTGFPTKLIINPDGYIVNTTVGEDPEFYNILTTLVR